MQRLCWKSIQKLFFSFYIDCEERFSVLQNINIFKIFCRERVQAGQLSLRDIQVTPSRGNILNLNVKWVLLSPHFHGHKQQPTRQQTSNILIPREDIIIFLSKHWRIGQFHDANKYIIYDESMILKCDLGTAKIFACAKSIFVQYWSL